MGLPDLLHVILIQLRSRVGKARLSGESRLHSRRGCLIEEHGLLHMLRCLAHLWRPSLNLELLLMNDATLLHSLLLGSLLHLYLLLHHLLLSRYLCVHPPLFGLDLGDNVSVSCDKTLIALLKVRERLRGKPNELAIRLEM